MPIYEFRCLNCGKSFEKLIFKKEEEREQKCPYCGSEKVEKLISGFYSCKKSSFGSSCSGGGLGFT